MSTLEAFDSSALERVLCVVAHPDDMEYGASAAVKHWTSHGVQVAYLLLTAGGAGMADEPEVVGPIRAAEQRAACDIVGVDQLHILDNTDGELVYGLDLRRDIARVVREFHPDAVLTTNFDVEAYGGLNQADHRAAGLSTVDAVRDADNTWVFRDLAKKEDLPKWHTSALLVAGTPDPTNAVIVDQADVDAAVASLRAHKAYLEHLPNHPDPGVFIPEILRQGGEAAGSEYAVALRVFDLGGIAGGDQD